jgi:TonB family protein
VLLRDGQDAKNRKEFLDYAAIQGHMFPQKVDIFRRDMLPLSIEQITVTPATLTDDVFRAPANALEIEGCDNKEPPKPKQTPEPAFPDSAPIHKKALVTVYAIVTKEGKVGEAHALSPDHDGFSESAVKTVRTWRFKPATCNGNPVAAEMNVEVSFNRF